MKTEDAWEEQGFVPFDGIRLVREPLYVSQELFWVVTALCIGGVVLSFYCLWFNVVHRKLRIIKMSSPNLNNVIIGGCVLAYISAALYGIDMGISHMTTFLAVCHVRMVVLAAGFSLGFGALFAKTWRVFLIFTNKTKQKIVIQDKRLLMVVLAFVAIDAVFFLIWFIVDPLRVEVIELTDQYASSNVDIFIKPIVYMCTSNHAIIWQSLIYVIKGILLVFGVFLAWQTRTVKIAVLNDSKYIGFAVYNVMTLCLLVLPATFVLVEKQLSIKYGVLSVAILISTITTEVLVFFPKILSYKRGTVDPADISTMGTNKTQNSATASTSKHASFPTADHVCRICQAKILNENSGSCK